MAQDHLSHLERAQAIAQRDRLEPILATRHDTDEPIWLVQSRSDPRSCYLLTRTGDTICCPCQHYHYHGICAHVAAVLLLLQKSQQECDRTAVPPRPATRQLSAEPRKGVSRTEAERQQREAALRREQALPWTDDKPFSMWKS